jgi:hypothetical protein
MLDDDGFGTAACGVEPVEVGVVAGVVVCARGRR